MILFDINPWSDRDSDDDDDEYTCTSPRARRGCNTEDGDALAGTPARTIRTTTETPTELPDVENDARECGHCGLAAHKIIYLYADVTFFDSQ